MYSISFFLPTSVIHFVCIQNDQIAHLSFRVDGSDPKLKLFINWVSIHTYLWIRI